MPPVRTANGGNSWGMPRSSEPVVNRSANLAPLDRRRIRPRMSGDEEDDTLPRPYCGFQASVDGRPGLIEVEPVKVEHPVGLDRARPKALVPSRIQGSRPGAKVVSLDGERKGPGGRPVNDCGPLRRGFLQCFQWLT